MNDEDYFFISAFVHEEKTIIKTYYAEWSNI